MGICHPRCWTSDEARSRPAPGTLLGANVPQRNANRAAAAVGWSTKRRFLNRLQRFHHNCISFCITDNPATAWLSQVYDCLKRTFPAMYLTRLASPALLL